MFDWIKRGRYGLVTNKRVAVGVLGLLLLAWPVQAEMYSGIEGGFSIPNRFNDIRGEGSETGTTISDLSLRHSGAYGLKFGYYLDALPWLGFEAEIFNSTPNIKSQTITNTSVGSATSILTPGATLRVLNVSPVNVVVRYQSGAFEPYAGVGLGIFMANLKDTATDLRSTTSSVGLNTQLGLRYRPTPTIAIFGEWKYNWTHLHFSDFTATPSVAAGGAYTGTYSTHIFMVGVAYHYD
ncbi:MAG: outer membrane beta-barrel protein [Nitrospira sp.]|nr:outer membrane beta-barrel protein [Nitrospira sp.]